MIILTLLLLCGCSQGERGLTIAYQFGTAYAPVEYMRAAELDLGVPVKWLQLQNSTAIRESMLSGETDIGFMAVPPFLIGLDGGTDWRIITGLSSMPMGLVTREEVSDISQIDKNARIALPQPGSIQHILLAMAAERQLNDAERFDDRLVTLSHPDGMSLLLSGGDINYHFTTAPYLQNELDAGMNLVLDGEQAFGGKFTGIVGVAAGEALEKRPELCAAFLSALEAAAAEISHDPEKAAGILAPVYSISEERLLAELNGSLFGMEINGAAEFADFMHRAGYLEKLPESEDMLFEIEKRR